MFGATGVESLMLPPVFRQSSKARAKPGICAALHRRNTVGARHASSALKTWSRKNDQVKRWRPEAAASSPAQKCKIRTSAGYRLYPALRGPLHAQESNVGMRREIE